MTDLDEFAFLWDGSQPGWRLQWINSQVWHVRVRFAPEGSTVDEIRRLRQLVPSFGALTAREAMAQLRGKSVFDLPEPLGNIETRSLVEQARALGLETEVEVEERSTFLPIRDGEVLIIEIDELARRVGERMKAEGLPVDLIEED